MTVKFVLMFLSDENIKNTPFVTNERERNFSSI